MDLYENGSLVKSVSYSHSMPTGSDLGIGGTGEAYYKGTIDDVRLYNRALSAAEVWDLYLTTGGT